MEENERMDSGYGQSLAVAVALAMLGISVGVNVQQVMAGPPSEAVGSSPGRSGPVGGVERRT